MRGAPLLFLASLLLAAGGCAYDGATVAEKRASFAPLARDRVQGERLGRFLELRTAALFPGNRPTSVEEGPAGTRMTFAGGRIHLGSATVLTEDGYLLTAAHCVEESPVHAYVAVAGGVHRLLPARVVWLGDGLSDDLDLALLKVEADAPLAAAFEWADASEAAGTAGLVAAGTTWRDGPAPIFAAGPALEGLPDPAATDPGAPPVAEVVHGVPLRKGDSGGPLATRSGRLVGVNVRGTWLLGRRTQIALRPSPAWIRARIEQDRRDRL